MQGETKVSYSTKIINQSMHNPTFYLLKLKNH
jgi:hypothetical protein